MITNFTFPPPIFLTHTPIIFSPKSHKTGDLNVPMRLRIEHSHENIKSEYSPHKWLLL